MTPDEEDKLDRLVQRVDAGFALINARHADFDVRLSQVETRPRANSVTTEVRAEVESIRPAAEAAASSSERAATETEKQTPVLLAILKRVETTTLNQLLQAGSASISVLAVIAALLLSKCN